MSSRQFGCFTVWAAKPLLRGCLLATVMMVIDTVDARSESCPTASDEIVTDRPDVTNSSLVVPVGSFQSENGINLSARDAGRTIDGTNSRWRLGIAPCLEVLVDLPTYFSNVRAPGKFWVHRCSSSGEMADQSAAQKNRSVDDSRPRAADRSCRNSRARHPTLSAIPLVMGIK